MGHMPHPLSLSGFTEKEFDDVKGIFLDTSLWLLVLTIFISFFHVSRGWEGREECRWLANTMSSPSAAI